MLFLITKIILFILFVLPLFIVVAGLVAIFAIACWYIIFMAIVYLFTEFNSRRKR
jgi:hypothetical protein